MIDTIHKLYDIYTCIQMYLGSDVHIVLRSLVCSNIININYCIVIVAKRLCCCLQICYVDVKGNYRITHDTEHNRHEVQSDHWAVSTLCLMMQSILQQVQSSLTLGAHAQEGYGSCLVCLSVTTLSATSVISTLKKRYVRVCPRLFSVFNSWIFDKSFRSEVMA